MNTLTNMPDDARIWIYQCDKILSAIQVAEIKKAGNTFIADWVAHGANLKASFDIIYNLFLIISVDEKQALASGCSIDKSIQFIKTIEKQFHLNLFDRLQVAYRHENEIKICKLNNLSDEIKLFYGDNWNDVIVFNNMVSTKKEFELHWETTIQNSWHKKEFVF